MTSTKPCPSQHIEIYADLFEAFYKCAETGSIYVYRDTDKGYIWAKIKTDTISSLKRLTGKLGEFSVYGDLGKRVVCLIRRDGKSYQCALFDERGVGRVGRVYCYAFRWFKTFEQAAEFGRKNLRH